MSGAVRDVSQSPPAVSQDVEICIVGSGCGGATAARVLAEAGQSVLVLEEGGDYVGRALTGRDEMYDVLYMDRGARSTTDQSIAVLQGRALGGGGVVNASDVVPIPEAVLHHWEKHHGLSSFSPTAMAPHVRRALEDLHVNPVPPALASSGNRVLAEGAEKLRLRGEYMQHNRVGCGGLGKCLVGCPLNAKKNPRMVAIPGALAAGARFYTRARVVKIEGADAEWKTLDVRRLDSRGYLEQGAFRIRARVLILAANGIASAHLLMRSKIGNRHVGQNLMLQPQLPVIGDFDENLDAFRGIPQGYAVTEFETETDDKGIWGFRIEGIMGTPGVVAAGLPRSGLWAKELMARYRNLAMALCLVPDSPSGSLSLSSSGAVLIDYTLRADAVQRFRAAAKATARIYLAMGARRVIVPALPLAEIRSEADLRHIDALSFEPASVPLVSAHQQGTVRFSGSEAEGGANPEGLVYGTRDIYVFDSSGYPSSASSHTMAPIISTSTMLSQQLTSKLG